MKGFSVNVTIRVNYIIATSIDICLSKRLVPVTGACLNRIHLIVHLTRDVLTGILDAHESHELGCLLAVIVLREPGAGPLRRLLLLILSLVRPQELAFVHLLTSKQALHYRRFIFCIDLAIK